MSSVARLYPYLYPKCGGACKWVYNDDLSFEKKDEKDTKPRHKTTHMSTPIGAVVATPEMAAYCCQVIAYQLQKDVAPKPHLPASIPDVDAPLFVCLKTLAGDLRGCIGTFENASLHKQLERYAINAAFNDRRFNPVRASELKGLKCTVSLLCNFEPAPKWDDWVIGTHGIRIDILSGKYGATYLDRKSVV